jgi:hypothetical protein
LSQLSSPTNTLLIIDGSYFTKSCKTSAALGGRRVEFSRLLRVLVRHVGTELTQMYWIDSASARGGSGGGGDEEYASNAFLKLLNAHQIRTEIRPVKSMNVVCHERHCNCAHSASSKHCRPIRREVQAGVDVAIATKILTFACENRLDQVVLLAGDGDFVDAIKYVKEHLHKKVFVVGFKDSMSSRLMPYAESPNGVLILDDLADLITQAAPGALLDKAASPPPPPPRALTASPPPAVRGASAAEMWASAIAKRDAAKLSQPPISLPTIVPAATFTRSISGGASSSSKDVSGISDNSGVPADSEALIRQLVDTGCGDYAACRLALASSNWNPNAALDVLLQHREAAFLAEASLSSSSSSSPPVAVASSASAPPAVVTVSPNVTSLSVTAPSQPKPLVVSPASQSAPLASNNNNLLLALLSGAQSAVAPAAPAPTMAPTPVPAVVAAPAVAAPAMVAEARSPVASSPRTSTSVSRPTSSPPPALPVDDNVVALIFLSNVRDLIAMGFEKSAAETALRESGGDFDRAVGALLEHQ